MDRWTQAEVLLRELRRSGHTVYPAGPQLMVKRGLISRELTDEQRTEIAALKPELLALVRGETFKAAMLKAVDELASQWVPDVQPSLALTVAEAELDRRAELVEQDLDAALAALEHWRGLWLQRCQAERSFRQRGQGHERGKVGSK